MGGATRWVELLDGWSLSTECLSSLCTYMLACLQMCVCMYVHVCVCVSVCVCV